MVIAEALAGIRCSRTTKPDRKVPAEAEFLSALLGSIAGDGLAAVRVRALPALGGAAARHGTITTRHQAEYLGHDEW